MTISAGSSVASCIHAFIKPSLAAHFVFKSQRQQPSTLVAWSLKR
jgi:hypothetical protein